MVWRSRIVTPPRKTVRQEERRFRTVRQGVAVPGRIVAALPFGCDRETSNQCPVNIRQHLGTQFFDGGNKHFFVLSLVFTKPFTPESNILVLILLQSNSPFSGLSLIVLVVCRRTAKFTARIVPVVRRRNRRIHRTRNVNYEYHAVADCPHVEKVGFGGRAAVLLSSLPPTLPSILSQKRTCQVCGGAVKVIRR